MRELHIAGRRIADDTDAWVIAEIGANHQGSVDACKKIIDAAAYAGADAVKLQKRDLDTWAMLDPEGWAKPYTGENSYGATYGEHRAFLEFGWDEYVELKAYAEGKGLTFFATAFDVPSLRFLLALGVPAIKLASASIVNRPLLEACAGTGIPVIASTGGATMAEVKQGWSILAGPGYPPNPFVLLACTAEYPCQPEDMNLRQIETYRRAFSETVIGLSDHYSGIAITAASYLLGARVIEKHFTLHRAWKGADQSFSLEPSGMARLVRDLKRIRLALGDGEKRRLPIEVPALVKMGRRDLIEERVTA